MGEMVDHIEMKVPAKTEYVGVVRLTVSGIASRAGFSYDDIEDLKIAVAEACTNVVDHAYKGDGSIGLGCNLYEDRLELIVSDDGQSFNLNELNKKMGPVDGTEPIEDLKEGGLGLFLIDSLMDNVEIKGDAGVAIVMTKFLQRDEVTHHVDEISASTNTQKQ